MDEREQQIREACALGKIIGFSLESVEVWVRLFPSIRLKDDHKQYLLDRKTGLEIFLGDFPLRLGVSSFFATYIGTDADQLILNLDQRSVEGPLSWRCRRILDD